ncbi:metalloregulator ArsR/SmtB family transcription factor [Dasania sp. GY-MA-18]|uniref:Metalloregulator ArsR/SmtB family transcription factor n=1 Tax=Dasania phycosphaerae TaxID=2950436 RepID=A0A9J6RGI2_9GAMM|nr:MULTISPECIES: metalloregulator ArsR/SmtB family transcription factor [Dasania]MCR8921330.1 metalloregulator ArsR/SmtB family transcription factor [Dasania sp. GY-MA-18]MCZ0863758.1 metalloregulator ArsR/SmtB family transcription factor [Dasania phycosphaerae]MCZ0867486.1 metalloregulator ArsR/SmtB family transcription factor [Dasania phycosphaerae]
MDPVIFYKCLAEETRLRCLMLIEQEHELCVCELVAALAESQPKISRHLAQLRAAGVLSDKRQGQWVFYQLNPQLPDWALTVIQQTRLANPSFIAQHSQQLQAMGSRPQRKLNCC